jgi:hypothetical protein
MTAKISLPFRYPGTTFAIRERDRFNLASPYTNFRFDVDGGKDVVAMVDGLLSIRHPTDPSLCFPIVLLKNFLTDLLQLVYWALSRSSIRNFLLMWYLILRVAIREVT